MKALRASLTFLPLLLTAAPRSFMAHDEGYYALQARWIAQGGQWLAPPWWDQVVFDRTIGLPWLIAAAYRLLGVAPWVAHLPSLVAAVASLLLTAALARRLLGGDGAGWLAAAVLALTPLWLDYAHLASQDMPLLALELLGLLALLRAGDTPQRHWTLLAGAWIGPAVLIKGFMVALPVLALLPFALLERRPVLRRPAFWLGLALGWLPVALWLGLSLRELGLPVVAGLWQKLLYLSESDVYSAGPLYYLWNLPANTFPWCLFALAGWRGWLVAPLERTPEPVAASLSAADAAPAQRFPHQDALLQLATHPPLSPWRPAPACAPGAPEQAGAPAGCAWARVAWGWFSCWRRRWCSGQGRRPGAWWPMGWPASRQPPLCSPWRRDAWGWPGHWCPGAAAARADWGPC